MPDPTNPVDEARRCPNCRHGRHVGTPCAKAYDNQLGGRPTCDCTNDPPGATRLDEYRSVIKAHLPRWEGDVLPAVEEAVRQQERSRYEGLEALLRAEHFGRDGLRLHRVEACPACAALAEPAPSPSTEDVCAECDGTKQVRAGGRVYPGTGAAYRMKPCPSCTKTGEPS